MPATTPTYKTSPRYGFLNEVKNFEERIVTAGTTISIENLKLIDTQVRAYHTSGAWPIGRTFTVESINAYKNMMDNSGVFSANEICNKDIFVADLKKTGLRSRLNYFLWMNTGNLVTSRCPIIYDVGNSIAENTNFVVGDATTAGLNSAATNKKLYHAYTNASEVADGGCSRGFRLHVLPPFDTNPAYIFRYANATTDCYDNCFTTVTANQIICQFSNAFSATTYNSLAIDKNYCYVRSATNRADFYEDASSVANSTASITLPTVSTASTSYCSIFSYNSSQYAKGTMVYFFSGKKLTQVQVTNLNTAINNYISRM